MKSLISFERVVWWLPALIVIHNTEEAVSIYAWIVKNISFVPVGIRSYFINDIFASGILAERAINVAMIIATLIPLLVTLLSWRNGNRGGYFTLYLILVWVIAVNSLQHIAASYCFRLVSPGMLSAIFLNLPFAAYLLYLSASTGRVSRIMILKCLPLGIIVHFVGIPLIWLISIGICML